MRRTGKDDKFRRTGRKVAGCDGLKEKTIATGRKDQELRRTGKDDKFQRTGRKVVGCEGRWKDHKLQRAGGEKRLEVATGWDKDGKLQRDGRDIKMGAGGKRIVGCSGLGEKPHKLQRAGRRISSSARKERGKPGRKQYQRLRRAEKKTMQGAKTPSIKASNKYECTLASCSSTV